VTESKWEPLQRSSTPSSKFAKPPSARSEVTTTDLLAMLGIRTVSDPLLNGSSDVDG
jgi:hypothetical protein